MKSNSWNSFHFFFFFLFFVWTDHWPVQCDSCHRVYKNRQTLGFHKKYECGIEPQVCLQYKFIMYFLGFIYGLCILVINGLLFSLFQFKCSKCPYRAKRKTTLKYHMANRHGLLKTPQSLGWLRFLRLLCEKINFNFYCIFLNWEICLYMTPELLFIGFEINWNFPWYVNSCSV